MNDFGKGAQVLRIEIIEKAIDYMKGMLIVSIGEFDSEVELYL